MEQNKSENGQRIAIAAISVVLCAALFYFFYYTKTPVYSMKLIGEAVQKHDLETFDRHVDVKHMAGRVFDDFVAKESKDKNGSLAGNAFALGLVTALKPVAVSEMQDAIYAEVAKKMLRRSRKKLRLKCLTSSGVIRSLQRLKTSLPLVKMVKQPLWVLNIITAR